MKRHINFETLSLLDIFQIEYQHTQRQNKNFKQP